MAKAGKKKSSKQIIDEAAQLAAQEAVQDLENEEQETDFDDDGDGLGASAESSLSLDVFQEGFKRCQTLKDSPRFHIKKNSQLVAFKDYPYSWEALLKEFGPGYYQVVCKARSNGRIVKSQTEQLGDPFEGREQEDTVETVAPQDGNLAVLGFLQQSQERAEARARESARGAESGLAVAMQTMMSAQQENGRQMMQMFMESAKQTQTLLLTLLSNQSQPKGPDPMMTLVTTLLTQKPVDTGLKPIEVFKMVKDAERDAETRANRQNELIDKKSRELAEVLAENAAGDGEEKEESLSKSLLKGFMPVIAQMIAGQGQQNLQLTPEQRAYMEEQQRLAGGGAALREGFIEPALRPGIPAARPEQLRQQRIQAQRQGAQGSAQGSRPQVVSEQGGTPAPVVQIVPVAPKEVIMDARNKEVIFNFASQDIAQAMVQGQSASKTAEEILKKLEKEGISRQTVANGFTLGDFYGYATQFGLPDEAKPWLKEFHEAIQATARPQPVRAGNTPAPASVPAAAPVVVEHGANGANGAKPVAPKRGPEVKPRTRVPVRTTAKDL